MHQHSGVLESTSRKKAIIITNTDQKRGEMKQFHHLFLLHTPVNQMWAELWLPRLRKPHPKVETEEL